MAQKLGHRRLAPAEESVPQFPTGALWNVAPLCLPEEPERVAMEGDGLAQHSRNARRLPALPVR
jgi:hypothetical protein